MSNLPGRYSALLSLAVPILFASAGSPVDLDNPLSLEQISEAVKSSAVVSKTGVSGVIGFLSLIRVPGEVCAIRITDLRRAHDEQPSTRFSSGEETRRARADVFHWRLGLPRDAPPTHEVIALTNTALTGVGRLAFGRGRTTVRCGKLDLVWGFPTTVALFVGDRSESTRVEIAPTAWTAASQVDMGDAKLRWFGYDEKRERLVIPVEHLPGGAKAGR